MELKDYAIKAFKEGSDNFGETVTGTCPLHFNTMKLFKGKGMHYSMTVLLEQKEDKHPCTSGIGFYLQGIEGRIVLKACSGHMLPWIIEITPEIQEELNNAIQIDF